MGTFPPERQGVLIPSPVVFSLLHLPRGPHPLSLFLLLLWSEDAQRKPAIPYRTPHVYQEVAFMYMVTYRSFLAEETGSEVSLPRTRGW